MTPVTFRRLESLGRLGNQLHELAATMGIADKMGLPAVFRRWSFDPYFYVPESHWVDDLPPNAVNAEETEFVQHIAERHRPYMQDRNLWAHIEDRIVSYFQPSELAMQIMKVKNPAFFDVPVRDRIGIHIRRGDAVNVPLLFPVQSPAYVRGVLDVLGRDGELFIFTDDPGWCFDHLRDARGRIVVGNADWEDQALLGMCQPAGTQVRTSNGDVRIEDLRVGTRVLAYSQCQSTRSKRMIVGREQQVRCAIPECDDPQFCKGLCRAHNHRFARYGDPLGTPKTATPWYVPAERKGIRGHKPGALVESVAVREFRGELVVVRAGDHETRYTPDHHCITKFGRAFDRRYGVYLMQRGAQFRVGVTVDPRRRLSQVGADACWIIAMFDDIAAAEMEEMFVAASFGVPDVQFRNRHRVAARGYEINARLDEFWTRFGDNAEAGIRCLRAYGRDERFPLFRAGESHVMLPDRELTIHACNVLDGMLMLDVDSYLEQGGVGMCPDAWRPVTVRRERYDGLVYSLKVAPTRTYVADGIATHNCDRLGIANSSYSYWAAIIGRPRMVCYPTTWYGPGFHDIDYKLMIPPGWVGIDDPNAGQP